MEERIVRKPTLKILVGDISDSEIDRLEKKGEFPRRRKITERIVGWSYIEIQAWIQNRLHADAGVKR